MENDLNFLHMDLDAFFASVEELDNPSLKGKPMVVGGKSQRGIITTANYEARKYGLHSAMPIFKATQLCPNVIIVPPRHDRYVEMSKKVFSVVSKYSNNVEMMSIDEGSVDISHLNCPPISLIKKIQKGIFNETGLTISVGLSYNKSLAKMASDWNKPQGFKIITNDMVPDILLNLPVEKIIGIGQKTTLKLHSMGIYKVEELMDLSKEILEYHFGKLGLIIYDRIRGLDSSLVNTTRERKSIGIERTFSKDIDSLDELRKKLEEFSLELSKDLKNRQLLGKTVSIKVRFKDFKTVTRNHSFEHPRRDSKEIYNKASFLIDSINIKKPIRLLGLTIANLEDDNISQLYFI